MAKRAGWVGVQSIEFMGQTGRGSKRVIFKRVNRVGSENSDPFCHVYLSLYALVHSPNMPKPASPIQFSSLFTFILFYFLFTSFIKVKSPHPCRNLGDAICKACSAIRPGTRFVQSNFAGGSETVIKALQKGDTLLS